MKILLVHADFIEFEPKQKAIKQAEESGVKKRVDECLVAFTAVEKGDERNLPKAAEMLAKEIKDVASQVKADNIVLYPYAHLSKDLSSPDAAMKILKETELILKKDFSVAHAPFGWYKAFTLKAKGHPLAELSREIIISEGPESKKDESEALKKEKEELKSEWYIIVQSGKMTKIEISDKNVTGFDFKEHQKLKKLVNYEMMKSRIVDKEPPHIKLMRRLELVEYEEGSDPGNFRYMPKGKLVKSLLEDFVTRKTIEYGAMEVETPIMYDYEHPALKSYLNRFPARQYTIVTPNKRVFLRFSACFGQFLMAKDATISYRNLPMRFYELTRYSFRVEQRGELAGLRRLRSFTMPDCHALCKDFAQAKEEMLRRFELADKVTKGSGLERDDMEFAIRVVKDFFEEHKDFVFSLIKKWGKPAMVEIWDKRFFYFVLKHEWNFIDALDKAATLTTDQIDVENAERYGIMYTDADNKRKYPLILHLSPSGAIERVIYALLEKQQIKKEEAEKNKQKYNQMLPMWLSPTQVRLCPVNDSFINLAEEVADKIEKEDIRVDVDDRTESVQKKIRDSEMEWVPMTVVIGEKEEKEKKYATRFRETGKVESLELKEIIAHVKSRTKGFPYKPLPLSRSLTKRPVFLG